MGGDIEIVPAGVYAKVHSLFGDAAYKTGDALFVTFVKPFRQGQEEAIIRTSFIWRSDRMRT